MEKGKYNILILVVDYIIQGNELSKIIRFEDLKNKKFEKRHIIYIIFAVIVIYIFYSIFLLVRKPTDTVTINSGVVTLEESATGYIIREEQVLKGNNYKNGLTAIVSEGERAAKGQTIFRYSSGQEDEIKAKIEEVNLKLQDALAKQTVITPTTDIKNLEKQIDEQTQNLRNLTDIHTITEYKKEIEELASKKAKIVGALSQSGAYIQELTKQKEQYEAQLISDSEYITAPVSGVVSYRVDGLEDALSTNDLSNLTEEKLENLGLKTGKIISTSQEARKNNK